MSKRWEAIGFDLDGTLLPMDNDAFTSGYFRFLCGRFPEYDPEKLVAAVWQGTRAMIANDGAMTNERRFWREFSGIMGADVLNRLDEFEDFYRTDFHRARSLTQPNPMAREIIRWARERADRIVLATNPVFPACGVETRLSWIGLSVADFDGVSTYENFGYCKPNPEYYREWLRRLKVAPEDCLMVGNDVVEDVQAAAGVGIEPFLITDCMITHDQPCEGWPCGSWQDLMAL